MKHSIAIRTLAVSVIGSAFLFATTPEATAEIVWGEGHAAAISYVEECENEGCDREEKKEIEAVLDKDPENLVEFLDYLSARG